MEKIAVIGLGYVGLPLAVALGKAFPSVIGFDISAGRIDELKQGKDDTGETPASELKASKTIFTSNISDLADCTFFIVTVPTPVDDNKKPDLSAMIAASKAIGKIIKRGAVVVFESTVYPGVTEEICRPVLEKESGLKGGVDFAVGYSPERINPGDKKHRLESIVKVVSAETPEALKRLEHVYGAIITAGLYICPSIKEAEAAKVLENTQRDINIALMNEMAMICDKIGIRTKEVLRAAGTKWNFLPFEPGLVGGHCVAVDPYYLSQLALEKGVKPQVILAGRHVNDGMASFVVQKTLSLLKNDKAKIGMLGLAFKENVPDLRSSLAVKIFHELKTKKYNVIAHDPLACSDDAAHENITLGPIDDLKGVDAIIMAVPHQCFLQNKKQIESLLKPGGVFVDVRGAFYDSLPAQSIYWSL